MRPGDGGAEVVAAPLAPRGLGLAGLQLPHPGLHIQAALGAQAEVLTQVVLKNTHKRYLLLCLGKIHKWVDIIVKCNDTSGWVAGGNQL